MGEDWYRERGDRDRRHRPRRQGHLPRPRPARRLPDRGGRRRGRRTSGRWSDALVRALADEGVTARARPHEGPATPASGSASARSPRSASTSRAVSRRTGSRSTSTTTSQPFEWVVPCGLDGVQMTSLVRANATRPGVGGGAMRWLRRSGWAQLAAVRLEAAVGDQPGTAGHAGARRLDATRVRSSVDGASGAASIVAGAARLDLPVPGGRGSRASRRAAAAGPGGGLTRTRRRVR